MFTRLIGIAALGSLLSLDNNITRFMIFRPLVVAPVFGALIGDLQIGIWVGIILEMFWLNISALGAAYPADVGMVAMVTTVLVSLISDYLNYGLIVFSLSIILPLGSVPVYLDTLQRKYNFSFIKNEYILKKQSNVDRVVWINLGINFLHHFLIYFIILIGGYYLINFLWRYIPFYIKSGFDYSFKLIILAGLATTINTFLRK